VAKLIEASVSEPSQGNIEFDIKPILKVEAEICQQEAETQFLKDYAVSDSIYDNNKGFRAWEIWNS
jgi:hypothetical protein